MWNSCTCVSQTLAHGKSKNEINKETEEGGEESKTRDVSMEKSKAGTKKRSPDGLSLPNQNPIIINIICSYFIRYGKSSIKFNYMHVYIYIYIYYIP